MNCVVPLPEDWGCARLLPHGAYFRGQGTAVRSYDGAGNQLAWEPLDLSRGRRAACDIESVERDCSFLAKRFRVEAQEFPGAWVATEVVAKLADVPILHWISTHGLFRPAVERVTHFELPLASGGCCAQVLLMIAGRRVMAFGRTA